MVAQKIAASLLVRTATQRPPFMRERERSYWLLVSDTFVEVRGIKGEEIHPLSQCRCDDRRLSGTILLQTIRNSLLFAPSESQGCYH
jgi:hypothetical protein